MKKYKTIQEAVDELNRLNANDEVRELAFLQDLARIERNTSLRLAREEGLEQGIAEGREKGIQQGIQQGIEQGIEQGINQEKINIAKKMLELNTDIQIIMNVTELSEDEIKKIKE